MDRRKFVIDSVTKSLGVVGSVSLLNQACSRSLQTATTETGPQYPIVISTWNNQRANEKAIQTIQKQGAAIDGIESGIHIPEADPDDMSVGYGGRPDREGNVTLDACIMDSSGNCGAVTYMQHIKHPISVARKVMEETPHVILSGDGATLFAVDQGFNKENLLTDKAEQEWKEWLVESEYAPVINIERHDTIGMLAIDQHGDISGGCSTSGLAYKMAGRVGDSPIIGAGLYVDNEVGAATATGMGEAVLRSVGSFLIVELMRQGYSPLEACKEGVNRIRKKQNTNDIQVGFIAINKAGEYGGFALKSGFVYAVTKLSGSQIVKAPSFQ